MEKITKVTLSMLVMVALLSSLIGCSSASAQTSTSASASVTSAAKQTESTTASETATAKTFTIGATYQDLTNEYIATLASACKAQAEALGMTYLEADGQGSAETQISQIENFIEQGVDAIILNAYEADGCAPAVEKANAAGIPIFEVCTKTTNVDLATGFVGSDDVDAGKIETQFIADLIGGKGNIAYIRGPLGHSAEIARGQGYTDIAASYPDMKIVFDQTANWSRDEGLTLVENWLQTGTEIDAVIAQNDEMALGAYKAIEAAGLTDKIPVIGIDAIADALQSVKDGGLSATVFQDAAGQGKQVVQAAFDLLSGKQIEKSYMIPFVLVTKDTVDQYIK